MDFAKRIEARPRRSFAAGAPLRKRLVAEAKTPCEPAAYSRFLKNGGRGKD